MINIPCVIFAGGKSSRMGEDKALLPFANDTTLTEFQYSRLSKIFSHVYISCKDKSKFDFEASFIEDIQTDGIYAPTVGFISSFEQLQDNSFFALSVDTPFINKAIITKIVDYDNNSSDATIASLHSNMQPMCGIYHRSLEIKFQQMLRDKKHKLGFLLKNANTKFVDFEDEKAFLNLNNPQEYQEALTLLSL